ncbi:hypothetical protein Unana1_07515 [Umbelopsis nana]
MLAYSAYKKYKENKAKSELPLTLKSSDSSESPLESASITESTDQQGVPRTDTQASYAVVTDKKEARKQWIALAFSLFVDVICPVILYYATRDYISQLAALLISSAPPAVMVIFKLIYYRKVDPLGLIIIFGFVLSAVISIIDSNPRVLLLRESIVTAATGILFLITLIPLKVGKIRLMPMTYGVTAQMMAAAPTIRYMKDGEMIEQTRTEFCWEWCKTFRFGMRLMTALWGCILLLEFMAKLIMYFSSLTVDQMVLYGNVVLGVTLGFMGVFTIGYSRYVRINTMKEVQVVRQNLEAQAAQYPTAPTSV